MRHLTCTAVCAAIVMWTTPPLAAQVHPTLERGFSPESVYQVGDLDSINTFNGNLTLSIPIGGTYPVGGRLSYQLTLAYNSSFWDNAPSWQGYPQNCPRLPWRCEGRRAIPTPFDTAGLGWRLSLGDLVEPRSRRNRSLNWLYVGPDGSRHAFVDTLHEGEPADPDVWYTRDNTYMRLRRVEPPWSGGFPWMVLEGADGIEREFHFDGDDWRLTTIRDTFGNHLDVEYGSGVWTLTDSVGRTQRLYWTTVADYTVIDRVELTAFGTSTPAVYQFGYANAPEGLDIDESCVDRRVGNERLRVVLLTSVTLPDGSQYRMVDRFGRPGYHLANSHVATTKSSGGVVRRSRTALVPPAGSAKDADLPYGCIPTSGVLQRLIVPTGAVYQWVHGPVRYPNGSGGCTATSDWQLGPALSTTAGVTQRTIFLDSLDASTWTYEYSNPADKEAEVVTRTVTSPEGHDTVYFFNTEPCAYRNGRRVGWDGWAYGLPFDPTDGSALRRSAEYYEGQGAERTHKKTRYVRYEHDQLPELTYAAPYSWYDSNRRLAETLVIHYDDSVWGTWPSSFSRSSNFDGLGHYRRLERGGFGAVDSRIEVTRYNPTRGRYTLDDDNNYTGSFTMLPRNAPWVLETYDLARQTEGGDTAKQQFCFGADTGLLLRQRTLRSGTTLDPHDLMAVFEYDPGGNLVEEHFQGGDRESIGTSSDCRSSLPSPAMGLVHEYQHGALRRTTHFGTSVSTLDTDIDRRTGLVKRSRDVSGVSSSWRYDAMGRVTEIAPDGGATATLVHHRATGDASAGLTPARIEVNHWSTSGHDRLAAETFEYDALGRLARERRLLPAGGWAEKLTEYTKGGFPGRVSSWLDEGATPAWTTYSDYDAFGRPRRVTTPDGSTTAFTYAGDRVVNRTLNVATRPSGEEEAFTKVTQRDYLGRVTDVREPIDGSQLVLSQYAYDIGGRLTRATVVTPEGQQIREFKYDNRGFLNWEQTPEKGIAGNGLATYGDYDARGNAWVVEDGSSRSEFTYDAADRLTRVREKDGAQRTLEERIYGTANGVGGNRTKGKLVRAVRHNYFDGVRDFRVVEDYGYRGPGGRVSERTTLAGITGENRDSTFEQAFTWNELGVLRSESYPRLDGIGPPRTVEYRYTNGSLTSVPGFVDSIQYHANGMIWRQRHANGVMDEQTLDSSGMARAGRVRSRYASQDWSSGAYVYDGAGNIARMGGDWFRYDGLNRLKEGTAVGSDGSRRRQKYQHDGFGNLIRIETVGQGSRTFTIDPGTNRVASASYDGAGNQTTWGSGPLSYQYTYSPFNQIHVISGGAPPVTRFFGYTVEGERVAVYAGDTDVLTYTLRNLAGKVVREYEQVTGTGASRWRQDYVWGRDGLLATVDAAGSTWHFHLDHLGTPRLITDERGVSAARHNYYPFGEEATDPFADTARVKFAGHERDLNLDAQTTDDLDYMHARFFNPGLGRFLSLDPVEGRIGRSQSWNRYSYARNRPLNLVDPDGRLPTAAQIADDLDRKIDATKEAAMRSATDGTWKGVALAAAAGTAADLTKTFLVDILRFGDGVGTAIADPELSGVERGLKVLEDVGRIPSLGKVAASTDETAKLLNIMGTKIGGGDLARVTSVIRTRNGRTVIVGTTTDGKVVHGFIKEREAVSVVYGQLVDDSHLSLEGLIDWVNLGSAGTSLFDQFRHGDDGETYER